jgi:3-deoxy-D-manno-octulosonic-acid transferase
MTLLYHIAIHLYYVLVLIASPFDLKARLWIRGRLGWRSRLKDWRKPGDEVIWVHAASLGEFEQGRTLMDELKSRYPSSKLLLTFFSPSGYEIRRNYPGADHVMYLPLDTAYNAKRFVKLVDPAMVFFIKYEFWYFCLRQLRADKYPVYLVSGIFRPGQVFFRWFGAWYRKSLTFIDYFFVQDKASLQLLNQAGITNCKVSGDTRFDRVMRIAQAANDIPLAHMFARGRYCLVAGSTWPEDEELLSRYVNESPDNTCFIIAPHEIDESHLKRLVQRLVPDKILYSGAAPDSVQKSRVLIVDNIGMLSSLYRYGQIAYIGGGFGKGIHNILEAAAFGIPVVFGPNYHKFREARELTELGGAFAVNDAAEFAAIFERLLKDPAAYDRSSKIAGKYVRDNTGATSLILDHVLRRFHDPLR